MEEDKHRMPIMDDVKDTVKRSRYNLRSQGKVNNNQDETSRKRICTEDDGIKIMTNGGKKKRFIFFEKSDSENSDISLGDSDTDTEYELDESESESSCSEYSFDEEEKGSTSESADFSGETSDDEQYDEMYDPFCEEDDDEDLRADEIRKKLIEISKDGKNILSTIGPKIVGNYAISLARLTHENSFALDEDQVNKLKDVGQHILNDLPTLEKILKSNISTENKADLLEQFMVVENLEPAEIGTRELKNSLISKIKGLTVDKVTQEEEERIRKINELSESDTSNVSLCSLRRRDVFPEIRRRIISSKFSESTKLYLLHQMDALYEQRDEEFGKFIKWFQFVLSLPTGDNFRYSVITPTSSISEKAGFMKTIRTELDANVFGMSKVKEYIECEIFHHLSNPNASGKCLGLCGPPGVGKTWIMNIVAKVLKRPIIKIPLGGKHDVSVLSGHSLTYVSSCPGQISKGFAETRCINPIILFDEIDKVERRFGDSINSNLIHVVDPVQNQEYIDDYVGFPYDISQALFVFLMNSEDTVNPILLNRMNVINIKGYTIGQKVQMTKNFLLPRVLKEYNMSFENFCFNEEVLQKIVANTSEEPGARFLTNSLNTIIKRLNVMKNLWDNEKKQFPEQIKENIPKYFLKDFEIPLILTREHIDTLLPTKTTNDSLKMLYL